MEKKKYNVAVVGATGVVGTEIMQILAERKFPVGTLVPLASERSAGTKVSYLGEEVTVGLLGEESFDEVDIALFSPGASVSAEYAPIAASAGAVVVDNTSHFRMDPDVPLVVPEVNPEAIEGFKRKGIIANPNCSTIQMVVALKPIHDRYRIKRVVVSTYQSVSGSGREAMDELSDQVRALFNMQTPEIKVYPKQIAFNCLPQIDVFTENGYTKEEMKMVNETRKILGDDSIAVAPTAVRVPVFISHSEAINVECEKDFDLGKLRSELAKAPGLTVVDNLEKLEYPTALDAAACDDVFVGRIRRDTTVKSGIDIWVVSDNLRKGAALNAVQIAELLIKSHI